MQEQTLTALTGREIKKGKHILVRRIESGMLVVNVIDIVTEPKYDAQQGVKTFLADAIYVGMREVLTEERGLIELCLDDIGAPWKGSAVGIQCRTFPYGSVQHEMLAELVKSHQALVSGFFELDRPTIRYAELPASMHEFVSRPVSPLNGLLSASK